MGDFDEFRKTVTIKRKSGGAYVNGHWVAGTEITITTPADIQSLSQEEMKALPEGRRIDNTNKIYTDMPLNTVNSENPDVILIGNARYEVIATYDFQHDILNHYKSIIQKVEQGL